MKYFKSPFFICVLGLSSTVWGQTELPNFELGIGGGLAKDMPMFNLDLTINMPINESFSAQINLDSDYVFNDPVYDDYAMSEFNGIGFYRMGDGRVGGGFGILEKKSRDDSFETDRTGVTHLLAAYFFDDVTLDAKYLAYESGFDRATSLRFGALWYPDDIRRIGVFQERYDGSTGWRIEAYVQPEKFKQKLSFGAIVRDGEDDSFPYIGIEMNYYFDRVYTLRERDRSFH